MYYTQISVWLDADTTVTAGDRQHPDMPNVRVITLGFASTTIHLPSDDDAAAVIALDRLMSAALTLRDAAHGRALAKAVAVPAIVGGIEQYQAEGR